VTKDACELAPRTANECLFNYVSSSLFIATNAPHPFLFSFLRYDTGGWGDYANAVAGKIGAVLFAGCVAGAEGEGKDVETKCCAKSLMILRTNALSGRDEVASSDAAKLRGL